jgi:hypothetical protein
MGSGMDLGRCESIDALLRRREAVEQRLSSSVHHAELVDTALAAMDRQLADRGDVRRPDSSLRASARALLAVALADADYDVTLMPAHAPVAVRVHNTLFGLQIDVVDGAMARPDRPSVAEPPAHQQGEAGPGGQPDALQG